MRVLRDTSASGHVTGNGNAPQNPHRPIKLEIKENEHFYFVYLNVYLMKMNIAVICSSVKIYRYWMKFTLHLCKMGTHTNMISRYTNKHRIWGDHIPWVHGKVSRLYNAVKLPWIFTGAPMTYGRASRNIQGILFTGMLGPLLPDELN